MTRIVYGGRNTYGEAIGVLLLDTKFPRPPGDIGNATTWGFPVRYLKVKGASVTRVVHESDPELIAPFIEGAKELERLGVRAITTSCGFLAMFHQELATAVNIPVFTSSLLLVPMIYRMLKPDQKVGILTGDSDVLGERHFNGVGWSSKDIPIAVEGMQWNDHWREIYPQGGEQLDMNVVGQATLKTAQKLVSEHPDVGAILFECTNLAPYAHLVQKELGLPVFDIQTLANFIYESTHRVEYFGHI